MWFRIFDEAELIENVDISHMQILTKVTTIALFM
jgi:hypothetical protein